ncbi:hypothetical protein EVAR_87083_1 [Eumeta japonica]|uniref:Uncharacterized protein n=1 Tax=Eumeta variegata TaxID=151549 RepID=A0A4C1VQJ2_EUMVA|nr:hypothetical protein EVAR_87083_1 [Eumeta japonica]
MIISWFHHAGYIHSCFCTSFGLEKTGVKFSVTPSCRLNYLCESLLCFMLIQFYFPAALAPLTSSDPSSKCHGPAAQGSSPLNAKGLHNASLRFGVTRFFSTLQVGHVKTHKAYVEIILNVYKETAYRSSSRSDVFQE